LQKENNFVLICSALLSLFAQTGKTGTVVVDDTRDELSELARSFNALSSMLRQKTWEATDSLAKGTEEIKSATNSLSSVTTEQAAALEEASSSVAEIEKHARSTAGAAVESQKLAEKYESTMTAGQTQISATVKPMSTIVEVSGRIARVIRVIDDIAFQTNLLALNAAVEAAKETAELVQNSDALIRVGQETAEEMAASLGSMMKEATEMMNLIRSISVASLQQARSVNELSVGLQQISAGVTTVCASSEETAASATELSQEACRLKDLMTQFNTNQTA
jgi:methyl-accepting chemotaxis protein